MLSEELRLGYGVRFRGDVLVRNTTGETRHAADWIGPMGKPRLLRHAAVTAERFPVGTVICLMDAGMRSRVSGRQSGDRIVGP